MRESLQQHQEGSSLQPAATIQKIVFVKLKNGKNHGLVQKLDHGPSKVGHDAGR
jgi:hypothetical protein